MSNKGVLYVTSDTLALRNGPDRTTPGGLFRAVSHYGGSPFQAVPWILDEFLCRWVPSPEPHMLLAAFAEAVNAASPQGTYSWAAVPFPPGNVSDEGVGTHRYLLSVHPTGIPQLDVFRGRSTAKNMWYKVDAASGPGIVELAVRVLEEHLDYVEGLERSSRADGDAYMESAARRLADELSGAVEVQRARVLDRQGLEAFDWLRAGPGAHLTFGELLAAAGELRSEDVRALPSV